MIVVVFIAPVATLRHPPGYVDNCQPINFKFGSFERCAAPLFRNTVSPLVHIIISPFAITYS